MAVGLGIIFRMILEVGQGPEMTIKVSNRLNHTDGRCIGQTPFSESANTGSGTPRT